MPLSRLRDLDARELSIVGRRPPVSPIRSIFAGAYAGIGALAVLGFVLPTPHD